MSITIIMGFFVTGNFSSKGAGWALLGTKQ